MFLQHIYIVLCEISLNHTISSKYNAGAMFIQQYGVHRARVSLKNLLIVVPMEDDVGPVDW